MAVQGNGWGHARAEGARRYERPIWASQGLRRGDVRQPASCCPAPSPPVNIKLTLKALCNIWNTSCACSLLLLLLTPLRGRHSADCGKLRCARRRQPRRRRSPVLLRQPGCQGRPARLGACRSHLAVAVLCLEGQQLTQPQVPLFV